MLLTIVLLIGFNFQSGAKFTNRFATISTDISNILEGNDQAKFAGSNRFFIWTRVIKLIQMKLWFGFGIENLQIPFVEHYGVDSMKDFGVVLLVDKAHNEYLHIAVSSGIPSMLIYMLFISFVLLKYLKSRESSQLSIPIFAAIIGYLAQAFFNISVVSVAFIFWIYLGLLTAKSSRKIEES